jgi:hypothetical protein
VTIGTGRVFKVRYCLDVIVTVHAFRTVAVTLPVAIIHVNSIDILPNSLAQAAASIKAKRNRTVLAEESGPIYPRFHQGQGFTVPCRPVSKNEGEGLEGRRARDPLQMTPMIRRAGMVAGSARVTGTMSTVVSGEKPPPHPSP